MNTLDLVQYAFLDSGIGGIPYYKHLTELYPNASCAYVADVKHFPYGEKTLDQVISFSKETVQKIIEKVNPQVIIIACNTISVSALCALRSQFDIPFVGTVPAIKRAVKASTNKRIAVLATERTVNDIYTQKLIEEFGDGCVFFMRADSALVKKIEEDLLQATYTEKRNAILPAMDFFKAVRADTAVLACTHFLQLQDVFQKEAAPNITIVDSLEGVVNQALKISPFDSSYRINGKNKFYINAEQTIENKKKYSVYADIFKMQMEYL